MPWNSGLGQLFLPWIGCLFLVALSEELSQSTLPASYQEKESSNHLPTASNSDGPDHGSDGRDNYTTLLNEKTFNTLEATQTYLSTSWEISTHLPYESSRSDYHLSTVAGATPSPTILDDPRRNEDDPTSAGLSDGTTPNSATTNTSLSFFTAAPLHTEKTLILGLSNSTNKITIVLPEIMENITETANDSTVDTQRQSSLNVTYYENVTMNTTDKNEHSPTSNPAMIDENKRTTHTHKKILTSRIHPKTSSTVKSFRTVILAATKRRNSEKQHNLKHTLPKTTENVDVQRQSNLNVTLDTSTHQGPANHSVTASPETLDKNQRKTTSTQEKKVIEKESIVANFKAHILAREKKWESEHHHLKPVGGRVVKTPVDTTIHPITTDASTLLSNEHETSTKSNSHIISLHLLKNNANAVHKAENKHIPQTSVPSKIDLLRTEYSVGPGVELQQNDTELYEEANLTLNNESIDQKMLNETGPDSKGFNVIEQMPTVAATNPNKTESVKKERKNNIVQVTGKVVTEKNGFSLTENISSSLDSGISGRVLPKVAGDGTSNDTSVSFKRNMTNFRISGVLKIIEGLEWIPELQDSNCVEYRVLSRDIKDQLENIFSKTIIGDMLKGIFIKGFSRSGSVIVEYNLWLKEYSDTLDRGLMIHIFNSQLRLTNGKLGKYRADLEYTNFEVPAYPSDSDGGRSDDPPVPQWAIAVIVIAAACLVFFILFGAVTIYGRNHNSTRCTQIYDKDGLVEDGRDWEKYLAAAYENLAADGVYGIREKEEKNRRYSRNCRTMLEEDWPGDWLSAKEARRTSSQSMRMEHEK